MIAASGAKAPLRAAVTPRREGLGVSQVFSYLAPYLRIVGVPDTDRAAFVGLFSALIFVVGMPLVPLWGVWAYRR